MEAKMVICMRNDLNMRKGKVGAQAGHAVGEYYEHTEARRLRPIEIQWRRTGHKKIVVQVDSEEHLLDVFKQAKAAGLEVHLVKDSGRTEFHGKPTLTCLSIGPDDEVNVDRITGKLKLM